MSERKLYLAGIGGNRYETTLEELKKQAFEGKIKRKDKIIVSEVVDEQAKEYVVLCEKVKGLEKYFIQGEAERAVEKRRIEEEKEAARIAREKEKEEAKARKQEEKINAQKERAEREQAEIDQKIEQIMKARKIVEDKRQREKEERRNSDNVAEKALEAAKNSINSLAGLAITLNMAIWSVGLILVLMAADAADVKEDGIVAIVVVGLIVIIVFPGLLFGSVVGKILRLPLQIAIYQVRAIEYILADTVRDIKSQETAPEVSDELGPNFNDADNSESIFQQDSTPETVSVPPREI